jgi:hypothetical protein
LVVVASAVAFVETEQDDDDAADSDCDEEKEEPGRKWKRRADRKEESVVDWCYCD